MVAEHKRMEISKTHEAVHASVIADWRSGCTDEPGPQPHKACQLRPYQFGSLLARDARQTNRSQGRFGIGKSHCSCFELKAHALSLG